MNSEEKLLKILQAMEGRQPQFGKRAGSLTSPMYDKAKSGEACSLAARLLNMLPELDPGENLRESSRESGMRQMENRLEAVAMVAVATIFEYVQMHPECQGRVQPQHAMAGIKVFFDRVSHSFGAVITHHIQNLAAKAMEENQRRAEAQEGYCSDGCGCSACQALRAKQTMRHGGELVEVDVSAMSTG